MDFAGVSSVLFLFNKMVYVGAFFERICMHFVNI